MGIEVLGLFAALIIGVSLGLIGGGGSILTVPVLVYLFGINSVLATAYSLFVVGVAASVGAVNSFRRKEIDVNTGLIFAIPSLITVYITRLYIVPAIPEQMQLGSLQFSKDIGVMVFFSLVMLVAAVGMLKKPKLKPSKEGTQSSVTKNLPLIIVEGIVVGLITGMVGAGGGFLIIPALVLLARMPMKLAVGTSLMVISLKSLIGFVGDIQSGQEIDWRFLLSFTLLAVLGIFIGGFISRFASGTKLKKGFGVFLLLMALVIIYKEIV